MDESDKPRGRSWRSSNVGGGSLGAAEPSREAAGGACGIESRTAFVVEDMAGRYELASIRPNGRYDDATDARPGLRAGGPLRDCGIGDGDTAGAAWSSETTTHGSTGRAAEPAKIDEMSRFGA